MIQILSRIERKIFRESAVSERGPWQIASIGIIVKDVRKTTAPFNHSILPRDRERPFLLPPETIKALWRVKRAITHALYTPPPHQVGVSKGFSFRGVFIPHPTLAGSIRVVAGSVAL